MKAIAAVLMLFAAQYAGRPLIDALRDLEQRGLHLIYSSEVIQLDMTVREEPRATEPRAILDELLRQHRLRAIAGPKGTLLIVRDESQPQRRAAEPAAIGMPVAVDQIVVTPSRFSLLSEQPEERQFMSREDVRTLPHFGDDVYRAINRVPGAASNDVSASFNIRGGAQNEVEVLLDGAEVYEPFHVKDLFNAFSMLDSEAIGSADVLTGGFPVEYGGRMSGVIDVTSQTPIDTHTELGISMLNSRLLTSGTFGANRGQWLMSFRPGYLHEVLRSIDSTTALDPVYFDLFGKLQWQFSDSTIVSANLLASRDHIRLDASDVTARARSTDQYGWIHARTAVTPRLFTQNVMSAGTLTHHRNGSFVESQEIGSLEDDRSFHFLTFKNDTSFDLDDRQTLKAGFKASRADADYDVVAHAVDQFTLVHPAPYTIDRNVKLSVSGHDLAAYASDRISILPNVVIEAGVRADRESYAPDGTHVTPRLNVGWAITPSTSIRAAWGRFTQPQRVDELPAGDGVTTFSPAQIARHAVIGVDHRFVNGWSARLEAYDKRVAHPRPRFENLLDTLTLFPEIRADRIEIDPSSAAARGAELLVRRDGNGPWNGWITFVRASARDDIDGRMTPRSWDQRNAVAFSVNYGYADRWNIDVAGTYHSGWPTTSVTGTATPLPGGGYNVHLVHGPLNDERLPAYSRVDLRASRTFRVRRGHLDFFVEMMNVFNRANVSRVEGFDVAVNGGGKVTVMRRTESIVPLIPSFGAAWRF